MNANPVAWFEIYVQDMDRARRFYETVLQTSLRQLNAPFPGIELWAFPGDQPGYGTSGALVKLDGCPSGGNATIPCYRPITCGDF